MYIRNKIDFYSSVDIRIRYDATHAIDVNMNRSRLNLFNANTVFNVLEITDVRMTISNNEIAKTIKIELLW